MKVKELIYIILDLCKAATSDDSFYTEDHVLFLCKKFRSFLLKKEQEKQQQDTGVSSEFEYQEICLDLEKVPAIDGDPCTGGYYLRTKQEIPKILEGTTPRIYPIDYYQGTYISYVSRDRMRYVGSNKYLQNTIYTSLHPNKHLYFTSGNSQFLYMRKIRMSAIFEDFDEASKYLCDDEGSDVSCDVMEADFPISGYLVPQLVELVAKELTGGLYKPSDRQNNASDDLSDLVAFIRKYSKSALQQQIEG